MGCGAYLKLLDNLLNGEGSSSLERSEALCQLDWELHFDDRGRIMDLDDLKEKIFRGGVEEVIRNEVWKFLLGYYDWSMDEEERGRHQGPSPFDGKGKEGRR